MTPSQQANIAAGQLLIVAAQKVSASFDSFSGWLLAGFGAALALFIANLDAISDHIDSYSIRYAAGLFLASAVLAVLQKLLAMFVAGGTAAGVAGAAMGKDLADRGIDLDVATFFEETKKALYWPGTIFASRAFKKAQSGDFAGPGRMYVKISQFQALIVVIQASLSLAAAAVVVCGLAI
jgi:hypothetical protein